MKRTIIVLFALLPMFLNAGVILKKSGDRIENVSIKSITDTEVIYTAENGTETSMLKSDVQAVLYDDGRYEEIRQNEMPASDNNVFTKDHTESFKVLCTLRINKTLLLEFIAFKTIFWQAPYDFPEPSLRLHSKLLYDLNNHQ